MSIPAYNLVWNHSRASGSALLVLLALADFVRDEHMISYPSVDTLAARVRVHPRQVKRLLRYLEDLGEIRTVKSGGGRYNSTVYRIALSSDPEPVAFGAQSGDFQNTERVTPTPPFPPGSGADQEPEKVTSPPPFQTEKGDIQGTETVTCEARNGDIQGQKRCPARHPIRKDPKQPVSNPSLNRVLSQGNESDRFARDEDTHPDDPLWIDLCLTVGMGEMGGNGAYWSRMFRENRGALLKGVQAWRSKTPAERAAGGGKAAAFIQTVYDTECARRAAEKNSACTATQ